ncbi:YceI family protein [Chitinophaga niabensis]|uniref:Polyisoprenoid-binding protein YceI n=1 Tax=Chitinophaga niabensis TaxID=536979 RepID=A0A1N6IWZ6_9BACT|nr:YceI family protein [Chitinophaga niabensis]SIO36563.1 Polyisoprenoid-binding protein YceI [Chitinophaga niabensis]
MKAILYLYISLLVVFAACSSNQPKANKTFRIVENRSVVEWKGSAPTHFHKGTFQVTGSFETNGEGNITSGQFVIPIASIINTDLPEPAKNELINHLKSPDFFNLAQHPEASFRINNVLYEGEQKPDSNQVTVVGDFSMIGQTHPINFIASVIHEGDRISVEATFSINRLKWGMTSFSDPKAELYILPDVELKLHIQAEKTMH